MRSDPVRSVGFLPFWPTTMVIMSSDEENDHVPGRLYTVSHVRGTTASALVVREPSSGSLLQADVMIRRAAHGHPNSRLHGEMSQSRGQTDQTDNSSKANLQAPGGALSANTGLPGPQKVPSGFATNVIGPLASRIMVKVSEDVSGMSLNSQQRMAWLYRIQRAR